LLHRAIRHAGSLRSGDFVRFFEIKGDAFNVIGIGTERLRPQQERTYDP
jgi:hypothetical protein